MTKYNSNAIIEILAEKKLMDMPSKGRNQWEFLKRFHGKTVEEYIEAAKAETKGSSGDLYQSGPWWNKELAWNLDKGNITLKNNDDTPLKKQPVRKEKRISEKINKTVSGLYVVTLNNEHPISSRADDKRHADSAVKVNKEHCKFGKAKDLDARRNNYYKTFGQENVNYFPLAALEDISATEKAILGQLVDYKIKGPAGVKTEWLKGIEKQDVVDIALNVLNQLHIDYKRL